MVIDMGYKSELLKCNVIIKFPELLVKLKELEWKKIIEVKTEREGKDGAGKSVSFSMVDDEPEFLTFMADNFSFYPSGVMEVSERYQSWNYETTKEIFKFLAPFLDNGSEMVWFDEYGGKWGFKVFNGAACELYWTEHIGDYI